MAHNGQHGPDEADFDFIVGSLPDGRVILDFQGMRIDHMKIGQLTALDMAEAIVEAVNQGKEGVIATLDRGVH